MGKHSIASKRKRRREQRKRKRQQKKLRTATLIDGPDNTNSDSVLPPFVDSESDPLEQIDKVAKNWTVRPKRKLTFKDCLDTSESEVVRVKKQRDDAIEEKEKAQKFAVTCLKITKEYKNKLEDVSNRVSRIDTIVHL